MPLPKEVEKQEAKADELMKQLYDQKEPSQQDHNQRHALVALDAEF